MFKHKTNSRHTNVPASAFFETLESRQLMSAVLVNGTLTVRGTWRGDDIFVSTDSGGRILVNDNGIVRRFTGSSVRRISVTGGLGDDDIEVSQRIGLPASIFGEAGWDTLVGGSGNDRIFGNDGADSLVGGSGNDILNGGGSDDRIFGNDGDDNLYGSTGDDTLDGGWGDDDLFGDRGDDDLYGGDDNDSLRGGTGDDLLDGGYDNDTLLGDAGWDTLYGGSGDDILDSVDGERDKMFGESGSDTLFGDFHEDLFDGGLGWNRYVDEFDLEF